MRINGLSWGQLVNLRLQTVGNLLLFLATTPLVRASIGEDLVICHDVIDGVTNLRLAHALQRTCRWRHRVVLMCDNMLLDRLLHGSHLLL